MPQFAPLSINNSSAFIGMDIENMLCSFEVCKRMFGRIFLFVLVCSNSKKWKFYFKKRHFYSINSCACGGFIY